LRSSAIHRSLIRRIAVWSKSPPTGRRSCHRLQELQLYAAGKLPPKSQDLVDRLTKATFAINDTLLWWIAGGVDGH